MKKILLLLVTIFMVQFYSFGQSTQCEPLLFPVLYEDCLDTRLCSLEVSLGDCGSIMVNYIYSYCFNKSSQTWVCTFKIETLLNIPEDCYYEYLGSEYEMFDIIMEAILAEAFYHAGCGDRCRPTPINPCGGYDEFYVASCWHWTGDPSPEPNDYMLEPCENGGCCRVMWQVCLDEYGNPQYIKLMELPEIPCIPNLKNGCHVIICGEL